MFPSTRLWCSGFADPLSAGPRNMGPYARCLRGARHREQQKNHFRCACFGCSLAPHNACWPASLAPTRFHVRLGAFPLEAGRQWGYSSTLIAYMFPVKGSDLALLRNHRGGAPGGQCDLPSSSPVSDSLSFLLQVFIGLNLNCTNIFHLWSGNRE